MEPRPGESAARSAADDLVPKYLVLGGEARAAQAVAQCRIVTGAAVVAAEESRYGERWLLAEGPPEMLFTENETNFKRLFGLPNATPYVKDSFHEYLMHGAQDAVNPAQTGTKCAAHYRFELRRALPRRSGCA